MSQQLQFMNCPHCGKRVRTDAVRCHHCGHVPAMRVKRQQEGNSPDDSASDAEESHQAAAWGGYDPKHDDFDYDEFLESEFGEQDSPRKRPWWWYVAWVVLCVFVLSVLADALYLIAARTQ